MLALLLILAGLATPAENIAHRILTHDHNRSAGVLENGVLTVSLWAGAGDWYPEGEDSPPFSVEALGEEGGPLSIPSPLIRAPEGTVVRLTLRNSLPETLSLHGLCDRPGACNPVVVASGDTVSFQFKLDATGTFHYWASSSDLPLRLRMGKDSQMGGVIVADRIGEVAPDHIFMIGVITVPVPGGPPEQIGVINGRSWPNTERLRYEVGDTARWRLVNLSFEPHAMHLHGFYFQVQSTGDGISDKQFPEADRRTAVTEQIAIGRTATITWVPERAGNWLFHCHMLVHMMSRKHAVAAHSDHASSSSAAGMAGIVLGIHVNGEPRSNMAGDVTRRPIQFVVRPDNRHGSTSSYKVDLATQNGPFPRVNDRVVPGPVMVLTRGEPVAVTIDNRLDEPTAIHWHGIELESYDDGVPGFGGIGTSITPPVEPGGTFTARFTPESTGTFIYHTHWHNEEQLSAGIYGPLIVLEPGRVYDPATDHIIVLGLDGRNAPRPDEPLVVNGDSAPRPLELTAGIPNRLRFINITANNVNLVVQLISGLDPIQWTLVGKDGSELPEEKRRKQPSRQLVTVGETYDFELAPLPAGAPNYWMEMRRGTGELIFQWPVVIR